MCFGTLSIRGPLLQEAGSGVGAGGPERIESVSMGTTPTLADPTRYAEVRAKVERVVELMRPAIQSDGGDLEFVDMTTDGLVKIRLHGACVGCPSSEITLQAGIERNLKAHVPAVAGVEAVD